jgi:N-acetylglutamate synthase-like GNAT family acetyltransferase
MTKPIVRYAKEDEISQIAEMIYQWEHWKCERTNALREVLNDKNQEIRVAELDGKIIGVLQQYSFKTS